MRLFVYLLFRFTFNLAVAQEGDRDCVNEYYARKKIIESMLKSYRSVYDFHKGEHIASIGAGSGNREIIYSMLDDSTTFYLQDINPICLEPAVLLATSRRLYNVAGRRCTASFRVVQGTQTETRLPIGYFDKIIVENSLHEFESPGDMLKSIRTNLKKGGYLFIAEVISKRPGRKHVDCQKPLYTEDVLIQLLNENGYLLKNTHTVHPVDDYDKIYQFELPES